MHATASFGQALGIWSLFALLTLGFGLLTRAGLRVPTENDDDWIECFWMGWCALIAVLQIWHLVHRIDRSCLAFCSAVATAGLIVGRGQIARLRRPDWFVLLPFSVGALWVADQSFNVPGSWETGLYHIQAIRWNIACPTVPGLANLHFPTGYNNSSLLYAALMEITPPYRGIQLASGLLVLAMLAQLLCVYARVARKQPLDVGHLAMLALSPVIFIQLLEPNVYVAGPSASWLPSSPSNISSPTPDLAMLALGVAITPPMVRSIFREGIGRVTFLSVAILASVGTTVKMSFLAFAVLALLTALLRARPSSRQLAMAAAACAIILLPFAIANLITSGYFLFPAYRFGHLDVPWRMPLELIRFYVDSAMKGWCRRPADNWETSLTGWSWVRDWAAREFGYFRRLGLPLCIAALAILVRVARFGMRRAADWLVVIPPLGGVVVWFFTMPISRYLGATTWCLVAASVLLLIVPLGNRRVAAIILTVASLVAAADSGRLARFTRPRWKPIHVTNPPVEILASGLEVHHVLGGAGMQMWDAPLVTTPTLHPSLRALVPGNPCGGFAQ